YKVESMVDILWWRLSLRWSLSIVGLEEDAQH
ncbi:hypothetical protein A2U01_0079244, partial [Trifolium medium]|nr:hypothetical protein [Trifolium medium]